MYTNHIDKNVNGLYIIQDFDQKKIWLILESGK